MHIIYNPIGKLLAAIALPAFADYIPRVYDLDGTMRLVALQLEIYNKQLPDSEIPHFLETAGKSFADPYTGKPMQWDAGKRRLYFKGMGAKQGESSLIELNL